MNRLAPLAATTTALAFVVVVMGAYVRLSDAGLGCPDWPGCYGRLLPSELPPELARNAEPSYVDRPFEQPKAWKEMSHRYAAGALGALIMLIAVVSYRRRHTDLPLTLPAVLVGLVIFQGVLGMWTVTLLLKPLIVTLHLLGGMTTLLLLWWLTLSGNRSAGDADTSSVRVGASWVLAVVYLQIALGGWTSSNYAALACTDFPTCHGRWWPAMDFGEGFTLWRGLGVNYEFGVLETPARTAIHVTHRLGAILTAVGAGWLAFRCLTHRDTRLQRAGGAVALALVVQITLGISNVRLGLPLPVAVAHNAGAALLLLGVATVLYFAGRRAPAVAAL